LARGVERRDVGCIVEAERCVSGEITDCLSGRRESVDGEEEDDGWVVVVVVEREEEDGDVADVGDLRLDGVEGMVWLELRMTQDVSPLGC